MPTVYSHQISLRLWRYFYLVALIAFPSFYASRTSQLSDLAGTISLQPAPTLTTQPSQTLASTPSAANFKNAWVVYLDARMAELKVVFTVACVLVGLSLTLFQIPQATNDPLTHALASLAQCRSISGLVFTAILYLYFKGDDAHTERFAMLWWKSVEDSKDRMWNIWIMLSLPAACVLWSLIFYLFAILRFTMHTIDLHLDDYKMPLTLAIPLQVAITISTLSDLICLIFTYTTLKGYRESYTTNVEAV